MLLSPVNFGVHKLFNGLIRKSQSLFCSVSNLEFTSIWKYATVQEHSMKKYIFDAEF